MTYNNRVLRNVKGEREGNKKRGGGREGKGVREEVFTWPGNEGRRRDVFAWLGRKERRKGKNGGGRERIVEGRRKDGWKGEKKEVSFHMARKGGKGRGGRKGAGGEGRKILYDQLYVALSLSRNKLLIKNPTVKVIC